MKSQSRVGKRKAEVEKWGFDLKFAYHVVRLIGEVEQILEIQDLDLQRDKEKMKAVRRGDWSLEKVVEYFNRKEKELEELYRESSLPYGPDEEKIKQLLLDCLEEHYGSLSFVKIEATKKDKATDILQKVRELVVE